MVSIRAAALAVTSSAQALCLVAALVFSASASAQAGLGACAGRFVDLGGASPGTGGVTPALAGTGCPEPGVRCRINVSGGLGGAPALIVVAAGPPAISISLFGGMSWVWSPFFSLPFSLTGPAGIAGAGGHSFSFVIPATATGGDLIWQVFILDPGGSGTISMTNGVNMVIG